MSELLYDTTIIDKESIKLIDVGNYRGSLHIATGEGKFYWAVECNMEEYTDWEWSEIPEALFNELLRAI